MSGADDLRTEFAKRFGSHLIADPPKRGVTGNSMADEAMRVLYEAASDPVRRLAILSLVGDTARCLACPRCGEPFRAPHAGPMPMEYDPGAYTSSEKSCPCCTRPPFGEPAFVVRPRGEATDA